MILKSRLINHDYFMNKVIFFTHKSNTQWFLSWFFWKWILKSIKFYDVVFKTENFSTSETLLIVPPISHGGGQLERSTHDLTTMKNSLSSIHLMLIIEMEIKKINFWKWSLFWEIVILPLKFKRPDIPPKTAKKNES